MNKTDDRIRELLDRNLFLSSETKARILAADGDTKREILKEELEPMDKEQTRIFRDRLERNPNLFEDMTRVAKERFGRD